MTLFPTNIISSALNFLGVIVTINHSHELILRAEAVCPSNGHRDGILLTFNGLSGYHNILVLDTFGNAVGSLINQTTYNEKKIGPIKMLRCLRESPWDGRLYLCNGSPADSKILALSAAPTHEDCTRDVEFVFTRRDRKKNPLLDHPYDIAFTPKGARVFLTEADIKSAGGEETTQEERAHRDTVPIAYVASQNAASVTWYRATGPGRGDSLPPPLALHAADKGPLPETGAFIMAHAGPGLKAGLRSIRGIAVSPDGSKLVVCDVFSQRLAVFDAITSEFLFHIAVPQQPVQVSFQPDEFFAEHLADEIDDTEARLRAAGSKKNDRDLVTPGFGHQMMVITTKSPAMFWVALRPQAIPALFSLIRTRADAAHNTNLAGVSAAPKLGLFFVVDRLGRRIARVRYDGYALDGYDSEAYMWKHVPKFGPAFLDHPEFVLHVDNVGPKVTRPCYELGPYGPRLSMLCVGIGFFIFAFLLIGGLFLFDLVRRRNVMPFLARKYRKRHPSMLTSTSSETESDGDTEHQKTTTERTPLMTKTPMKHA